jgi:hypothetical protein
MDFGGSDAKDGLPQSKISDEMRRRPTNSSRVSTISNYRNGPFDFASRWPTAILDLLQVNISPREFNINWAGHRQRRGHVRNDNPA